MKTPTAMEAQEIARQGQALYEAKLRSQLEIPENRGKILVLDIDTGEYALGETHLEALRQIEAISPDGRRFSLKVGYPALARMSGGWRRDNAA